MHFFKEITKLKIRKVLNQRLTNEFAKSFSNVSILVFRPNLRNIFNHSNGVNATNLLDTHFATELLTIDQFKTILIGLDPCNSIVEQ